MFKCILFKWLKFSFNSSRYYFGPYVVPNINSGKVKEVNIIVAHTLKFKPL